jgi:hypothetical protein
MAISSKTLTEDKYHRSDERTLPFRSRKKMAEAMVGAGVAVVDDVCAVTRRRTRQGGAREQWKWRAGLTEQAPTEAYVMRFGILNGSSQDRTGWSSSKLGAVVVNGKVMDTGAGVDLGWISRLISRRLAWNGPPRRQSQPSLFQGTTAARHGPGRPVQTSVQVQLSARRCTGHTHHVG